VKKRRTNSIKGVKPKILVVGSSNTDMIVHVPRIPNPGETVLGGEFSTAAGGKGANQAVAAARAGAAVTLIACVGGDIFGQRAVEGFVEEGIDTQHVAHSSHSPSGVALIFVSAEGQNSIAVAPGANALLSPAHVRRAAEAFRGASALLMQLETPLHTVADAARLAWRQRVPVILNPAPAQNLPDALLRRVWILTPNESEASALSGLTVRDEATAAKAAAKLRQRGASAVIITLGERGAFVADAQNQQLVGGFKVKAVDTTAAGDVFNGALAVALGEGQSLLDAARFANAAAAISVTRRGAQPSAPSRREIERLLKLEAASR
jgi:ribokinase